MIEPILEKAEDYAHEAHDSIKQVRKYTGKPYWTHTDLVASHVAKATTNWRLIAAAHLHDVIEDVYPVNPRYSLVAIRNLFGGEVARMVYGPTDQFTKENYPELNRKARKKKEAERLGAESAEVQTIKLADLIANSVDIVSNDADFARVYLREKVELLTHLTKGDQRLWKRASKIAEEGYLKLGLTR